MSCSRKSKKMKERQWIKEEPLLKQHNLHHNCMPCILYLFVYRLPLLFFMSPLWQGFCFLLLPSTYSGWGWPYYVSAATSVRKIQTRVKMSQTENCLTLNFIWKCHFPCALCVHSAPTLSFIKHHISGKEKHSWILPLKLPMEKIKSFHVTATSFFSDVFLSLWSWNHPLCSVDPSTDCVSPLLMSLAVV